MSAERPCRFAGLAFLLVLAACGSTEPSKPNGLTILTGGGGTDSIDAALPVALRVEVRDPAGGLRSGAKVVLRGNPLDATLHSYDVLVSAVDFIRWVPSAEATTDAKGRAEVRVRLGLRAGPATLNLTVPELGLSQTATYTVTPGSAARIRLTPGDSTVSVGGSYQVDAVVTDRGGNARQDPVTLAATGPELGVAGMQITGRQAGRGAFIARAGSVQGTGSVSVVPVGTLAAWSPTGIVVVRLDGSGSRVVTSLVSSGFAWNPAGTAITLDQADAPPDRLRTVTVATGETRLALADAITNYGEATPAYSADGVWLYFTRFLGGSNYHIWRAKADGTGSALVPGLPNVAAIRAVPSPDGRRLAYVVGFDQAVDGLTDLQIFDLQAGRVEPFRVAGHSPRWSPSGNEIAYVDVGDDQRLKIINADGTGGRNLAGGVGRFEVGIDWSPDGKWIVARAQDFLVLVDPARDVVLPLPVSRNLRFPVWKP